MTRPAYVQMAVRVPEALKLQLEKLAGEQGKHVSEIVRELLLDGVKDRGAPTKPAVTSRSGGLSGGARTRIAGGCGEGRVAGPQTRR